MTRIGTVAEMRIVSESYRNQGKRIGFVPTMGALHEGHLSLVRIARERTDAVVVSVFVNPLQFGKGEDFDRYPRNLERDAALLERCGTDILFCPREEDMYAVGHCTYIDVERLSSVLEGEHRPGHFRGVTTVVAQLFNIVRPHVAVFGQKDAQQAVIIRQMIRDLHYDIEMIVAPIVREADGLAMSSRNAYLAPSERTAALSISRGLRKAEEMYRTGEKDAQVLARTVEREILSERDMRIDYVAVVNPETLVEVTIASGAMIAVAARVGNTRLIDNTLLGQESAEK
ncbi:MAG: pantoate--beta-alanine ligase [Bacteroidota bacterium]|nr:pantoate--beta-alanine ligase [Bacteroidota bacterium]